MAKLIAWVFLFFTLLFNFQLSSKAVSTSQVSSILQSADNSFRAGFYASALNDYKRALSLDSNNPNIHFGLASCYLLQSNYNLAIEHFQSTVEINPAFPEAYFGLSLAFSRIGDQKASVATFRKGLGLDLEDNSYRVSSKVYMANSSEQETDIEEKEDFENKRAYRGANNSTFDARRTFRNRRETSLESTNTTSADQFNRKQTLTSASQSSLNLSSYNKVLPEEQSDQPQRTNFITNEEKYYQQIIEYNEELRTRPKDTKIMYRIAILYLKLGKVSPAEIMQRKVSKLDFHLGNLLAEQINDYQRALL
ncbi:MAG TPA: tetratricopeptide repeat protein [Vampirovibrionales bacterium]